MTEPQDVNQELINDVNNHLNSVSSDLKEIHHDIREIIVIEEREAKELSSQNNRAFPDEQRAVMKANNVLDELKSILDGGIKSITNMERYIDIDAGGEPFTHDRGDPGVQAAVNYLRVIATLGEHTLEAIQVQIKFEAEVENTHTLKEGKVDLSENQKQYIQQWINETLEILEDFKEVLEEVLQFGEEIAQKYEDELLYEVVSKYRGNIIGGEIEKINREEEELQELAQNI